MPPCRQGNGHWAVGEQCGLRAKAACVSRWLWGSGRRGSESQEEAGERRGKRGGCSLLGCR